MTWRFSAEQAREAVLAAGQKILEERGMDSGLGRVTLNEAISVAGVPRGSAYRLWTSPGDRKPQDLFRTELLVRLIKSGTAAESQMTFDVASTALQAQTEKIASREPSEMAQALRQVIRLGTAANLRSLESSTDWYVYLSSLASMHFVNDNEQVRELAEAHRAGEREATYRYIDLYKVLSTSFGLRLRTGYDWEHFAALAAGAAQGSALRFRFNDWATVMRPTGPGGAVQEWTNFGVTFEALIILCFEADPESEGCAAIHQWLE